MHYYLPPQTQPVLKQAIPLHEKNLATLESTLGPQHLSTLSAVSNIAESLLLQGGTESLIRAEAQFRRALEGREKALGPSHPHVVASQFGLAQSLFEQKSIAKLPEAEKIFRRVLDKRLEERGATHPETCTTLHSLAACLVFQERDAEAEPLEAQALEGFDNALGSEHLRTLEAVRGLAKIYMTQKKPEMAQPHAMRDLEETEKRCGDEAPETFDSVVRLATCYQWQNKWPQALPLLRRVLEGRENLLGDEHEETIDSVYDLAMCLQELAKTMQDKGYDFWEEVDVGKLAPPRPAALTDETGAPKTPKSEKDSEEDSEEEDEEEEGFEIAADAEPLSIGAALEEAEELHMQALEFFQQQGDEDPKTIASIANALICLTAQEKWAEAEPLHKRNLQRSNNTNGLRNPVTLQYMYDLADCQRRMELFTRAEPLYRQCLEYREKDLGYDHLDSMACCTGLATTLWAMEQPEQLKEVEELFTRALKQYDQQVGPAEDVVLVLDLTGLSYEQLHAAGKNAEERETLRKTLREAITAAVGEEVRLRMAFLQTMTGMSIRSRLSPDFSGGEEPVAVANIRAKIKKAGTTIASGLKSLLETTPTLKKMTNAGALEVIVTELEYSSANPLAIDALTNLLTFHEERQTEHATEQGQVWPPAPEKDLPVDVPAMVAQRKKKRGGPAKESEPVHTAPPSRYLVEMEAFVERMIRHQESEVGPDDPSVLEMNKRYMHILQTLERHDEVEQLLEQDLARAERDLGVEHLGTLLLVAKLADCRRKLGKAAEAILPMRKRVLEGRTKFLKKTDKDWYLALKAVYDCLCDLGRDDEGGPYLAKMERWEEDETERQRKAEEARRKEEEEAARVAAQKAKIEAEEREKAERAAALKRAAEERAAAEKAKEDAAVDDLTAKALARAQAKKAEQA
eukprot:TRINITY_DN49283_c0_g1_i1.p1 TRINITY_DN49283_c0_g1~~TRINITY_DN49283_c0_g1_i1.p1  ORF type:complete len:914 (+),score=279.29 TRINITY_DN49283_c0_g1_i1:86-2827(+)